MYVYNIYILIHISHVCVCVAIDLNGDLISQWIEARKHPIQGASTIGAGASGASQFGLEGPLGEVSKSFEKCDPQSGFLNIMHFGLNMVKHTHLNIMAFGHPWIHFGSHFVREKCWVMDSFEATDIRHLHHSDSVESVS